MFVVILTYLKPLEEVRKVTPEHRDYLQQFYTNGTLLVSGPQKPPGGGLMVANTPERSKVDALIEGDPYHQQGCAKYDVIEFDPLLCQEFLKPHINV